MKYRLALLLFSLLWLLAAAAQDNITKMEYYIDTDPGFGAGVDIPITGSVSQDLDIAISTTSLAVGFHELVIRARDASNEWSIHESSVFFVSATNLTAPSNITTMEYFFDSDPGYGSGTSFAVGPGTTIDADALIAASSLSKGFHELVVRALDGDGTWGLQQSRVVYIDEFDRVNDRNLTSIEYFIDTDPGIGAGTSISIDPAQPAIDQDLTVSTSALPNGNYALGVRVEDSDGNYSVTEGASFEVCTSATAEFTASTVCQGTATLFTDQSVTEAGDTYSWDFDNDGTEDSAIAGDVSFTYPSAGEYTAVLTIDRGGCEAVKEVTVTVASFPAANAGLDQNITASTTSMDATALQSDETGEWTVISGTVTISDTSDPKANLSEVLEGETELRWTVTSSAGCTSSDDVRIIRTQPTTSSETDIVSFSLTEQASPAEIDASAHTVSLVVTAGTSLTNLDPTIGLSQGATISPSGPQNFTNPVAYTVVAEDGVTQQVWTATVTEALSDQTDILSFTLAEQHSAAVIDATLHTISLLVELGTDLTSLEPTIELSQGATISPTGPLDFTNPVAYAVIAEDGVTAQTWTVTVMERPLTVNEVPGVHVYPNPSTDILNIRGISKPFKIRLLSTDGRKIIEGESLDQIRLAGLANGTYVLCISIEGSQEIRMQVLKAY